VKPTPILLRSGDCIVMSNQSRFCYHGVPLVFSHELDDVDDDNKMNNAENIKNDSMNHGNNCYANINNNVSDISYLDLNNNNNNKLNDCFSTGKDDNNFFDDKSIENNIIKSFLKIGRININVRQVVDEFETQWLDKTGTDAMLKINK
jgi:hypothetical protein